MHFGDQYLRFQDEDQKRWIIHGDGNAEGSYWHAKERTLLRKACPFCGTENKKDFFIYDPAGQDQYQKNNVTYCQTCAWWSFEADTCDASGHWEFFSVQSILREFDQETHRDAPDELLRYVSRNKDKIQDLSPKQFEELVASVYKNCLGIGSTAALIVGLTEV